MYYSFFMTRAFRENLSIKDNQTRPISINLTQNSIFIDGKFKYVYCVYCLDLYTHKILYPKFTFNKPNDKDIQFLVEKLLKIDLKFSIVAFKGSPFFNKKVQDFLEENKIQFFYYTRCNVPTIVLIVNAYITRMLELHILYNHRIHYQYVMKLLEFWKKEIIPITYDLSNIDLIEDKSFLISNTKETNNQEQEIKSFNSHNHFNQNLYIYKTNERAFMLISVSAKLNKKTSWNILCLFNLLTFEFVDEIYTKGSVKEKHVINLLKDKFEKNRINCLFIPEGPQFNSKELLEFYQAMELQVVVVNNNQRLLENRIYLTMMKILHNYIKDSLSKGLSSFKVFSPDKAESKGQENQPDIEPMKLHWNNSITKIFKAQVDLASQFYSNEHIDKEKASGPG